MHILTHEKNILNLIRLALKTKSPLQDQEVLLYLSLINFLYITFNTSPLFKFVFCFYMLLYQPKELYVFVLINIIGVLLHIKLKLWKKLSQ